MNNKFNDMRNELKEIAEKEAYKLWRLARKAEAHHTSDALVRDIREEAWLCYHSYTTYPERLLDYNLKDKLKYAFR